jgi:glycosyltransferase involved in cell wall biosynthesis
VVIAGRDRRAYSYEAPSHGGSWKQHLLAELEGVPGLERVIFPGLLNYAHYLALLQRCDLNIYFSRPYVVSWGLLQAAACGTPLLLNHSPAIAEVIPADAALAVDLDQPQQILAAARQALQTRLQQPAVAAPEAFLAPRYHLDTCLAQWQDLINRALSQRADSGRLDAVVPSP